MNTYWTLYWITRLDSIHELGKGFIVFGAVGFFIAMLAVGIFGDDDMLSAKSKQTILRLAKWLVAPMFVVGIIIQVFIPTTKEAMVIAIGGKTLNYVQADTSLQKIPEATTKLLLQYIEKAADEMKTGK